MLVVGNARCEGTIMQVAYDGFNSLNMNPNHKSACNMVATHTVVGIVGTMWPYSPS